MTLPRRSGVPPPWWAWPTMFCLPRAGRLHAKRAASHAPGGRRAWPGARPPQPPAPPPESLSGSCCRPGPLRQLGSHSVLGSSPPFHVSRKSSRAAAGPGPGLLCRALLPPAAELGGGPGGRRGSVHLLRGTQVRRQREPSWPDGSAQGVNGLRRGTGLPSSETLVSPIWWGWKRGQESPPGAAVGVV